MRKTEKSCLFERRINPEMLPYLEKEGKKE